MTMIQNILFPVDFSPSCVAMTPLVKKAAAVFGAKVSLLHVVEIVSSGFELMARPVTEVVEEHEYLARERLNSFLAPDFPVDECPRVLRLGDPAMRIAQVAREARFDIIVMPTHAGTFRRMLLGSTTAKVLNDADCPVLTTEHAETITPRPLEHREWVCATGLQQDSERVLRYAGVLAESVHANLQVIHAIPAAEQGIDFQFDLEERAQSAERQAAHSRVEELLRNVGLAAPVHIAVGPVKDALIETARRLQADAVLIGRSAQAGVRLRDLTYAIVRDAPCPVLSV
ncbi:MAG TPA: universal stress protein [Terriglobia bacterium]|nr:universal stress protein [Terriglobia bacterium]